MAKKEHSPNWGGAREGAGRKSSRPRPKARMTELFAVRCTPVEHIKLDEAFTAIRAETIAQEQSESSPTSGG